MTQSRYTENGVTMVTEQRRKPAGWRLVGEEPDWLKVPRCRDLRLDSEEQLRLEPIQLLEDFTYPEVARHKGTVTSSKLEPAADVLDVLIPRGSKVEYITQGDTKLLIIANVVVDGRRMAQLSFVRSGEDSTPKLRYYPASTLVVREEHAVRY